MEGTYRKAFKGKLFNDLEENLANQETKPFGRNHRWRILLNTCNNGVESLSPPGLSGHVEMVFRGFAKIGDWHLWLKGLSFFNLPPSGRGCDGAEWMKIPHQLYWQSDVNQLIYGVEELCAAYPQAQMFGKLSYFS